MDETHVYGTARPSKGSTMVGSRNFSGEQNNLHANVVGDSSGDHASLETDPGTIKTDQLDQYGLPEPPESGQVIEVDEPFDEVLSQSASTSLADTTGATEDQSLPFPRWRRETLSKNQLASNQAQLHLLERQGVVDEFLKQHATSVSSKEFAQTNKTLVTCINVMRDTAKLAQEQTSLKLQRLQAEIAEMKKMEKQLSEVERTQKEFQGTQSQADAKLITMHEANEKRWEKQPTELGDSLQQRVSADVKLINEDMLGLADSVDKVTAQVKTNQSKVDKELNKLTTEVASSFNNFRTQSTLLQDNLSQQIRSLMLEVKQEVSKSVSVQASTGESSKSRPDQAQSPIRPKGTKHASSTQFPNTGRTQIKVPSVKRSRVM